MSGKISLPRGSSLTTWTLLALVAGVALGVVGHFVDAPIFALLTTAVAPFGTLFVNALQMLAIPLVVVTLLAAVTSGGDTDSLGMLGLRASLLFVTLLVAGALFSVVVSPLLIAQYSVDPVTIARLQSTAVPDAARAAASASAFGGIDLVESLVPRSLMEAALRGQILPLLVFTVLFGIAVARLPDAQRTPLAGLFQSVAAALLQCTRWVLVISPIGVFALIYPTALQLGGDAAGVIVAFIVVPCIVMILFGLLLYPATAVLGRTTMLTFARAAAPAQLVALTTRSSIVALPALIQGGRDVLGLPASALSFVLPFSVAIFKINRPISGVARLLIVAHVYGVPLTPLTIVTYIVTIMLMSFATAGVPATPFNALPAYLAAGIPIEGFIISEAVDVVPDMFKTWINVTGDLSVATLLSRSRRTILSPVSEAAAARAVARDIA